MSVRRRSAPGKPGVSTTHAAVTAGQLYSMAEKHAPGTPERRTLEELSGWLRICENGATGEQMDKLALAIFAALIVKDRKRMQDAAIEAQIDALAVCHGNAEAAAAKAGRARRARA